MLTKTDGRSIQATDVASLQLSTNNAAVQMANAISQTQGVVDLSAGQVISGIKVPTSIKAVVRSNAGSGAISQSIKLFNNILFGAIVINNGSGVDSVVTTFGDKNSGNTYSRLMQILNQGNGINIKGMSVKASHISNGTPAAEFFTASNLKVLLADSEGNTIPFPLNIDEADRNTQQKDGLLTIFRPMQLNGLMQLVFDLAPDILVTFTLFTDTSTFKG